MDFIGNIADVLPKCTQELSKSAILAARVAIIMIFNNFQALFYVRFGFLIQLMFKIYNNNTFG